MRVTSLSFALLLLGALPLTVRAEGDPRQAEIKTLAEESATDFKAQNWSNVLDATHPKLLQLSGGKAQSQKMIEVQMAQVAQAGMTLEKYQIGEPGRVWTESGWQYSFVPAMMVMKAPDRRVTVNSYLMALKGPEDPRWYFLDGAMMTPELLAMLVPELGDGKVALPPKQPPKVEQLGQPAAPAPPQ
ncbi:MAG: hypothetical protein AAGK14_09505 [Verrucomicrobiota bacterium]